MLWQSLWGLLQGLGREFAGWAVEVRGWLWGQAAQSPAVPGLGAGSPAAEGDAVSAAGDELMQTSGCLLDAGRCVACLGVQ